VLVIALYLCQMRPFDEAMSVFHGLRTLTELATCHATLDVLVKARRVGR
jgi:hypothetical protein